MAGPSIFSRPKAGRRTRSLPRICIKPEIHSANFYKCHGWSQNKGFILLLTPLGDAGWPRFPPYESEKQRKPVFRERDQREVETKWKGTPSDADRQPPPPGWFGPSRSQAASLTLGSQRHLWMLTKFLPFCLSKFNSFKHAKGSCRCQLLLPVINI